MEKKALVRADTLAGDGTVASVIGIVWGGGVAITVLFSTRGHDSVSMLRCTRAFVSHCTGQASRSGPQPDSRLH